MPKLVDHAERRQLIVEATWRIIANRGFAATTARDISAALGVSLGSVNHYFPTKDDLLLASYQHVFIRTNTRYERRVGAKRSFAALRVLLEEMAPIGDEQRLEARVVLSFWERCASSPQFAAVNGEGLAGLTRLIRGRLREAIVDGEVAAGLDVPAATRELLTLVSGMQSLAVLLPTEYTAKRVRTMLKSALRRIEVA